MRIATRLARGRVRLRMLALLGCLLLVASPVFARAPDTFEEDYAKPMLIDSPMWWALELKAGPYRPGNTNALKETFGNDDGWLLSTEIDVTLYHIPKVGQLNLGAGFGWAAYDAKARDSTARKPMKRPSWCSSL